MRTLEEITADIASAMSINNDMVVQSLLQELEALGTPESMAASLNIKGNVLRNSGDHAQALESFQRALQMYEELGRRDSVARVTGNMGTVYQAVGDHALALEQFRRALQVFEENGNQISAARVVGNLGIVFYATGDFSQALEHYRRALHIYEALEDRHGAAVVTGNIGSVYASTGNFSEALEHFRSALRMHEELGERSGEAAVTGNMGNVLRSTGDYTTALVHYQRAKQIHEELGNHASAAGVTGNIVAVLLDMHRYEEAETLLQRQASMVMDAPSIRAEYHANVARLAEYYGTFAAARDHLEKALQIVSTAGERNNAAGYHEDLRDLAKKCNDFEGYVQHNEEYLRLTEEIRGREATQRLAMIEADRKMESERRERDKERALLYGALPASVALRMLRGEDVSGDQFDSASVLFLDIAGFTAISDRISPRHVVHLLKAIFKVCDDVCKDEGLTRIKTIGDSYMAVAGVPEPLHDHAHRAAHAALAILQRLNALELTIDPKHGETLWHNDVGKIQVRMGLHCGPLVAGIVGEERLQYDVWGDTVNVASRMESTGEPGRIQVSSAFAEQLLLLRSVAESDGTSNSNSQQQQTLTERGTIEIKGKGKMTTYWLEG